MSILDQVTDNILEADSIGLLPETATADDLSSAVSYRPDDASPLKRVSLDTPKVPPQQAVQDAQIAKAKGVTPELVAQQRERFTVENELDEIVNATVDAPATRRYLTNPNNLQVSRNDAGRLAALERAAAKMNGVYGDEEEDTSLLGYFWQYAKGVVSDIASGNVAESERWNPDDTDSRLRFEMSLNGVDRADLFRVRSELMRSGMSESEAAAEAMRRNLADRREYWQGVADDPDFAVDEAYRNPQTFAEKVFAAAGGTAPGMAATVINPVVGTLAMTQQIYGSEYRSLVASGADPKAASDAAFISSLAQMPLEFAGNMIQLNAAAKMLKAGPTRDFLVNLLQGGLSEGLEEYLQQAPGLYGEIRAHNPDWTQEQIFAEFFRKLPEHMASAESGEAFLIGGTLGMVLPGAAGAIRLPSAIREQNRIEANSAREQELLSALDETAQATETGQLSPEHLQAAVQAIRDQVGENVSTVYVDAEAFIGNLGEEAGAVAERVGISDQLDAAYSSGGLLEIPIAKYAAHIAAVPELNNALIEHRKFSPGSMTLSEQQAYFASQQDEMQRLMDVVAEEQAAADIIEQEAADVVKDLTEKLKATGRIKGKERDNAILYASRLATLARRSGGQYSVKELYETYGPILGDSLADVTVKSEGRMMEQAAVAAETAGADVNNAAEVEEAARLWREQGTESPYFKRWFGDSKVVDKQGRPLVMYHGTRNEIEEFSRGKIKMGVGFFFTKQKSTARGYADRYVGRGKGSIVSVYLKLTNPLDLSTEEGKRVDADIKRNIAEELRGVEYKDAYAAEANRRGYDGMLMLGGSEYVVFSPTQIKSVNNRGTFDPSDARIMYQSAGALAGAETESNVAELNGVVSRKVEMANLEGKSLTELADLLVEFHEQPDDVAFGQGEYLAALNKTLASAFTKKFDALEVNQPDGTVLMLHKSSKEGVNWQVTTLSKDGIPWGDTPFNTKKDAVLHFIHSADPKALADGIRRGTGEAASPGGVLRQPTQDTSRGLVRFEDGRIMYQSAFHGSPYRFDKFTLDAIGTGEGAQAYGWGLYFAGRKDVAEFYRRTLGVTKYLSENQFNQDGTPNRTNQVAFQIDAGVAREDILDGLEALGHSKDDALQILRDAQTLFKDLDTGAGQLYEVDIPEDDVLLHWDKPLSEQPEKVREALLSEVERRLPSIAHRYAEQGVSSEDIRKILEVTRRNVVDPNTKGEDFYADLTEQHGSDKAASEYLNSLGIKGIKYLDGTSRSQGEGSYNYVIFDDNAIEILNTFYQAKEARPNLQNMQDYARGATFFANSVVRGKTGQPLVALFKHSDESTFMHEAGHVFLEMTRHLATQPGAHPEIVREWQDIKAALGIPNDGKIKSKHHEAFAEALEKYLAQGKAPSMKLRHVFERFFAWMRSVYRSWVSEGVTPDERLVPIFDRMFATDEEIAEVEEYYAAQKPFFTAAEMQDKDEQDRYLKRIKAAQESSREKQFRRYWNAYKKALGGKKRFEEEAKTEVDAMPVYAAADEAVSKGGFSGEDLDYMIGNDLRAELAKKRPGLVTKKGGAAPESVALKYGYDSVQDMVADILNAESKTEAVANRVKHALIAEEQRLRKGLQERGELNGDEAFHGAEQLAVLAAEFEMAQARARGRKAVEKAAKDFTPPEAVQADARAKAQEAADRFHAAWKTKDAKELRAFVRATLDAMQSYQTLAALKEAPLDRDHLVKYYGKDTVADLDAKHPGIIKKGSGRAADDAATELGYADTDALIAMLQDTEPRKAAYDSMLAEYEAEFRSDTFDEEAKVFADTYQRFVDSDPRTALARAEYNDRVMLAAGKPSRVEVAAVRAVARKMLAGRKVKDAMNPVKFQTQERKAANAALAAKAKGDMDAALEWKRRQLLNHALVIESMKIREERATTVARLKRALKRDIADTYNAQVVSLLSKFRLTGREAKEGTPTLEAFLESIQNSATDSPFMGAVPDLPRWLFDDSKVPAGGATLADTLTVDELRELDAAVKWLVETGYDIKQGRLAAYNEHIKDLVAKLTEPMRELKDKRVISKRFETWRRLSDATREYFADHNMLIFVLDALDGYTNVGKKGSFGPNRRTIGNALADRQSERDKRMGEASEKLKPIMAQFAESMRKHPKILRTTVPVPEVMREDGDFWNFPKVLAVALNMGNATNMQRVMEGYELTPEQLTELTSVLSPEDWNAVQQVWDTLNEYWVDMNDVHKRTYHFEMNKVKADPITVRASDGSQVRLRGGYYPIKFNPRYARQVGAWSEKDDLMQDSVFGHPATKSGMTKDRKGAGVRLPVLLDISVLYGHIEDSIHFITHADLIRDLDRITQNTEFQNTVRQKMGREVAEMFRPMLRHIARPERQMNVVIERGFDRMRAMSTAYILGLNTSVALKQVFSLPGIWHDIGMSNYAKGLIHVMRNPVQAYHAMREASTYMATRSDSFDRDLKDSLGRMSGGRMSRGYLDVARDWAFALIRLMDFVAVYPSWHGAYKLGLEKEGSHEGAVRFADEMIRQSQPSSKPMDMSKIQYKRGGLFKAMSMFMTFTAKYGNRQRHFARAYFKDKKITTREYAWHLLLEAIAPPVLMNLMFAAIWGDEPDEKDMLIDVISYQFSGYVLLRDIAGVASAAVKQSALDKDVFKPNLDRVPALTGLTLAERAVTNTVKWVADMDDEDARNKAFLDVAELLSFFAGVPAPKLARKLAKGYEQFEDDGNPLLLVVPDYSRD